MKPIRVSSAYLSGSGSVTTSRTRLVSVYAGSGGTAVGNDGDRQWELRNGSASGDILLYVIRYSNGGYTAIGELEIPEAGIIFTDGIHITLSWTPLVNPAITLFYQ